MAPGLLSLVYTSAARVTLADGRVRCRGPNAVCTPPEPKMAAAAGRRWRRAAIEAGASHALRDARGARAGILQRAFKMVAYPRGCVPGCLRGVSGFRLGQNTKEHALILEKPAPEFSKGIKASLIRGLSKTTQINQSISFARRVNIATHWRPAKQRRARA